MHSAHEAIQNALEILQLPPFVTREEIKKQYRFMAKKHHPDRGGESRTMEELNKAYAFLNDYIDSFRYTFDTDEISKQYRGVDYAERFKP